MTIVIATSDTGPDAGSAVRETRDLPEARAGAAAGEGAAARRHRAEAHETDAEYDGTKGYEGVAAHDGAATRHRAEAHESDAAYDRASAREEAAASDWQVAPARPTDRPALQALFAACSQESVRLRFFGQLRAFPREYLDAALAGVPQVHDAVVAYRDGDRTHLAGMASLVAGPAVAPAPALTTCTRPEVPATPEPGPAELAVLVCDAWQRQGAGTAMITALLARARERGVVHVRASVLPGRTELLAALSRRLPPEPDRSTYTRDGLSAVYKLQ